LPGTSLGLLAGYRRGWLEQILSRFMDAWLAFPGLLLALVLVARMGPSLTATMIALGIVGIPSYYRLVRNGTLSARHALYVEAACSIGASNARILLRHILPNLASPIVVLTTLRLGTVLLAGGGLSFIGLGAQPPQPEWGALLAAGRGYMDTAWWLALFPGLAITVSVMGFNLLGDGLRDALAPDVRSFRRRPPSLRGKRDTTAHQVVGQVGGQYPIVEGRGHSYSVDLQRAHHARRHWQRQLQRVQGIGQRFLVLLQVLAGQGHLDLAVVRRGRSRRWGSTGPAGTVRLKGKSPLRQEARPTHQEA